MTSSPGIIASRTIDTSEPVEDIAWVVPGFAARGYLTVLAGPAGVGKSTLALQYAGDVGTPDSPALYLDIENGPAHLRRLYGAMGLSTEAVALVDMQGLSLTDADTLAQLTREILGRGIATLARHGYAGSPLVVIDSLRRFAPGRSENSSDDMAPYVASLTTLARETRSAVVLIHHSSSKPEAPAMRGSSAIEDQTDIAFKLSKCRNALRLSEVKFRPGVAPPAIYYSRELDPLRLVETDAPTPGRELTRREACAEEIVQALGMDRLKRSAIAARIGRPAKDGTVGNALADLVEDGTLTRHPDGSYSLAGATLHP